MLLPLEELFLLQLLLGQLLFPLEGGMGLGGAAVCAFPGGELLLLQRRRSFISSSSCGGGSLQLLQLQMPFLPVAVRADGSYSYSCCSYSSSWRWMGRRSDEALGCEGGEDGRSRD